MTVLERMRFLFLGGVIAALLAVVGGCGGDDTASVADDPFSAATGNRMTPQSMGTMPTPPAAPGTRPTPPAAPKTKLSTGKMVMTPSPMMPDMEMTPTANRF